MPREEMIEGDDENIVGALMNQLALRSGARMPQRGGGTVSAPRFSTAQLQTQVGGTQNNKLRAPLGLGSHVFVDNAPFKFIVEPQEAFRGERLIVDTGTLPAGVLLSVDEIMVGSPPPTPSPGVRGPAAAFLAGPAGAPSG